MKSTALILIGCLAACDAYKPTPVANALVHLSFEGNFDNLGALALDGEVLEGKRKLKHGETGKAFYALGDGGWAEFSTARTAAIGDRVEIAFDFKRDDWINPYAQGRAVQTIAVVSAMTPGAIHHLSFNLSGGASSNISVGFTDLNGEKHRLSTPAEKVLWGWRHVRLIADRTSGVTEFYLDGVKEASVNAVPLLAETGFDRIKLGTWYKKNQAYRGQIDNFIITSIETDDVGTQAEAVENGEPSARH